MNSERCVDCAYRYAVGRSPRCNICRKAREKDQKHDAHLRKTYGITLNDYHKLSATTDNKCFICGGGTSKNYLAVDHDHKSGEVRGLLCATCNKTLGRFRDDAGRFDKAASYLRNPPARTILGRTVYTP